MATLIQGANKMPYIMPCPECGGKLKYYRGYPGSQTEPPEDPSLYCRECDWVCEGYISDYVFTRGDLEGWTFQQCVYLMLTPRGQGPLKPLRPGDLCATFSSTAVMKFLLRYRFFLTMRKTWNSRGCVMSEKFEGFQSFADKVNEKAVKNDDI